MSNPLFLLEAAKSGHRLIEFTDRGGNYVVECGCGEYVRRISKNGPNPGDEHEAASTYDWREHVIDAAFTTYLETNP